MVVGHFDVKGVSLRPYKAHAPLIVDADAVLILAVPFQSFETIAGRNAEIMQGLGGIENQQLAQSGTLNVLRQTFHSPAMKQVFRAAVAKAPNHSVQHNGPR